MRALMPNIRLYYIRQRGIIVEKSNYVEYGRGIVLDKVVQVVQ